MDNFEIAGILLTFAIIMAMGVGVAFGMALKYTVWFFTAAFVVLTVLMARLHWAAGTFTVIVGSGGIAILVGIMRWAERNKRDRMAKTGI